MSDTAWAPNALMAKAFTACASARALIELRDMDGAANRAYYAMFDAARAALTVTGAALEPAVARTHSGLIAAFGQHLVKTGRVPRELGRQFNRAHEIRLVADYNGQCVQLDDARTLVTQAKAFVATLKTLFLPDAPSNSS